MKTWIFLSACLAVIGMVLVVISLVTIKRSLKELSDQELTEEISSMILYKYTLLVIGGSMTSIAGIVIIILKRIPV